MAQGLLHSLSMNATITKEIGNMTITASEIIYLRRHNHVVYVYPRKREVSVDGFKRYMITEQELSALRQANNGLTN